MFQQGGKWLRRNAVMDASPETLNRIALMSELTQLHAAWNAAEAELTGALGVPVCVDGCGACCFTNTPVALGIEVEYLISWILSQPKPVRNRIFTRAQEWFLERRLPMPVMNGRMLAGEEVIPASAVHVSGEQGELSPEEYALIFREFLATTRGTCPFFDTAERRCGVHEARPMVCRAANVTWSLGPTCPRPLSRHETEETRGYISGPMAAALRQRVNDFMKHLAVMPYLAQWWLLPAGLLRLYRSRWYTDNADRAPRAKRLTGYAFAGTLFEDQKAGQREVGRFNVFTPGGEVEVEGEVGLIQ